MTLFDELKESLEEIKEREGIMKLKNSGDTCVYHCGSILIQVEHQPYTYNRVIEITREDIERMLRCFGLSSKETLLDKEAVFIVPHGEILELSEYKILEIHQYFINEDNDEFDFKDEEGNNYE